jgi:hypothetical protein
MSERKEGEKREVVRASGFGVIQARTLALAQTLRKELQLRIVERRPEEVLELVEERGFEGALDYALSHGYVSSWQEVANKLRSIVHLVRNSDVDFLECWLQATELPEDVLVLLYQRNRPFLRSIWSRGGGGTLLQIEADGIVCFAENSSCIAFANRHSVWISSLETGRMNSSFLLDGVEHLAFSEENLYLSTKDGLYGWNEEGLQKIQSPPCLLISSFAGWVAVLDIDGAVRVLYEDFLFHISNPCTVMVFCQRGLAVALGTEKGVVYLCTEGSGQAIQIVIPSRMSIRALFWEDTEELWIGDEEGALWFWDGVSCVLKDRFQSAVLAIGRQQNVLCVVMMSGLVQEGSKTVFIPEPFSVSIHDREGYLGMFAHDRCCHVTGTSSRNVDSAFLIGRDVLFFSDYISRYDSKKEEVLIEGAAPPIPFCSYSNDLGLDIRGGIWGYEKGFWVKKTDCPILDLQQGWIYEREIFVISSDGLRRFDESGVCLSYVPDVCFSGEDGYWQLDQYSVLKAGGRFVRVLDALPSRLCSCMDMVFVSQGPMLYGYDQEDCRVVRRFSDLIVSMTSRGRLLAVGMRNRVVEIFDVESMSSLGRFRLEGSIIRLQIGIDFRLLVTVEGGGAVLLMVDGMTR